MAPTAEQIGEWLERERRRDGRFSQEQAAQRVGTTARTLWSWEKGKAPPPTDKFLALCLLYGVVALNIASIGGDVAPAQPTAMHYPGTVAASGDEAGAKQRGRSGTHGRKR